MKLLTAEQIRSWDEFTMLNEPVSSLGLMERAATACTQWIIDNELFLQPIKIFCGKGNNGGDGLAISRLLMDKDVQSTVYILEFGHKGTDDFQANLQQLHKLTNDIHFIQSDEMLPVISKDDIIIDALLGAGLNRKLDGLTASLVQHINQTKANVISIDVPTGMFLDHSSKGNIIIKAKYTLTFQTLKQCLLAAENSEYFGVVEVLDIGLDPRFLSTVETSLFLMELDKVQQLYQPRNNFSHKGHFGHALIIGGTEGKTGAAILSTEACLRSGAGLTSVHLLSGNYTALNSRCPEAMTVAGNELTRQNLSRFSSIGIGPGLGTGDVAQHLVSLLINNYQGKLLLDADALNIISQNKNLLTQLPAETVLTPHPKEFDRLFGEHDNEFARWDAALHHSRELNCTIVLKGHHTLVAVNGKGYFNTTGNAGLAKGGSGDVLTGIITSLLAQSYKPQNAALLGVFLHGLAADLAMENQSYESLLASDVSTSLGKAFKKLSNVSK